MPKTLPHIVGGHRWLAQANRPRHLPAALGIDGSKIASIEQSADHYGQQDEEQGDARGMRP
jgi:hypothetical protein